jgi:hypothetical protein
MPTINAMIAKTCRYIDTADLSYRLERIEILASEQYQRRV